MNEPMTMNDRIRLRVTLEFLWELLEYTRQPWIESTIEFLVELRDGTSSLDHTWYDSDMLRQLQLGVVACDDHIPMTMEVLSCPVCRSKQQQQR